MRNDTKYLKLVLILAVLGVLISGWLLSIHIKHSTGMAGLTEGCSFGGLFSGGQGCANVAVSKYSDVFGFPLAGIAMGYYLAIFFIALYSIRNLQAAREAVYVQFLMATGAIIVTVTMFFISKFVLASFCPGCAMLWLINLSIWPCLVLQLELKASTALGAIGWLTKLSANNLQLDRLKGFVFFAAGAVGLTALIAMAAEKQMRNSNPPPVTSLVDSFRTARQVFLPPESLGGIQAKGSPTPVLDIVEMADMECPHCKFASQFLRPFVLKNKDKVRVTYVHFPLDGACNPLTPQGSHTMACAAAKASICAGADGKFWEMHDLIFDHQAELSKDKIDSFVQTLGLDKTKYDACLASPDTEMNLQKQIRLAELVGLQSTPTLVINGRVLVGARQPNEFEELLKYVEQNKP